jgi:hypothetical protein
VQVRGALMLEIETEIEIFASAQRVWSVLLDFPAYSKWNPFVRVIGGLAKKGDRLTV